MVTGSRHSAGPVVESKTLTTYRRTDGELIFGEYGWVSDLEFFEELDGPIEILKETWVLESSEVTTFAPVCSQCDLPATHWGLCESHAQEDDPEFFAVPVAK